MGENLNPPSLAGLTEEPNKAEGIVKLFADRERGGSSFPMEGKLFYDELRLAEVGENGDISGLVEALENTRAYLEGLSFGFRGELLTKLDPEKIRDPRTRNALSYLRNIFLTVEGSSKRPNAPYVRIQEKLTVENYLAQSILWRQDPQAYRRKRLQELRRINKQMLLAGKNPLSVDTIKKIVREDEEKLANEYLAADLLLGLNNHIEAREEIDKTFLQRMSSCENPKTASELGGEIRAVTPDGPTWESFFHTEEFSDFGSKVDELLEEIVKFGMSEETVRRLGMKEIPSDIRKKVCRESNSVYAGGFKDTIAFAHWIKYLLNKADGRLDIVWTAWKLALLWEIPEELGIDKRWDTNHKFQKYVFAVPPVGNSLMSSLSHLPEKRMHEYGLDANGKRYQGEKFVTHSGLPISIDVIPNLCEDFLHQTKLEFDKSRLKGDGEFQKKLVKVLTNIRNRLPSEGDPLYVNDYEKLKEKLDKFLGGTSGSGVKNVKVSLWDLRFLGGWKFSDPLFPWLASDQPPSNESEAGELPMGAFGSWLLTRSRAFKVLEDIKLRPKLSDLGDPDFFASRLRNWVKVLGTVKRDVLPERNPRAVILAAYLYYRLAGTGEQNAPLFEGKEDYKYRTKSQGESVKMGKAGSPKNGVLVGDILHNAEECGWLRNSGDDARWIIKVLGLHLGI